MVPRSPSLFPDQPSPIPAASTPAIIAHCDGGARGNPGPAGYGVEITDAQGNVLAELSEFLGFRTNNFAEYSGLLASLQYALDHGYPSLRVVSDSLLMVKQIQGAYKVKSPDLIPLWGEAKRRIAKLDRFEITHALRHKNKAADRLANAAMDRGMSRGTPAEGRPVLAQPDTSLVSQRGVQSIPLRALPYPAQASPAPAPPTQLDPAPQPARPIPAPVARTHAPIILNPEPRPTSPPATPTNKPKPTTPNGTQPSVSSHSPTMLRGFTHNGAIHLLGPEKFPDGIFVKVIPE